MSAGETPSKRSAPSVPLVVAHVFLLEAEGFGGVEHEHLHADVGWDLGAGQA